MLLDCVDVQAFKLHNRLDMPFECVKLSKPISANIRNFLLVYWSWWKIPLKFLWEMMGSCKWYDWNEQNSDIPSNLGTPLGLLSNLRQLSIAVLLIEDASSFWRLKSMQSPLSKSPLSFSLLFSIIFLCGEGSLQHKEKMWSRYKFQLLNAWIEFLMLLGTDIPCSPASWPMPFHLRCIGQRTL